MEEAHHISAYLGCSFHRILREANNLADGLAREIYIIFLNGLAGEIFQTLFVAFVDGCVFF